MEAYEIFSHQKFREKVLGMETCEIFFPTKKLREKVLGMEACEIFFPQKNLGRRFLEWKLVRFFSHKKNRGKVPGMETFQIGIPFFFGGFFLVDFFETKKTKKLQNATLQLCNFWTFLPFLIKKQFKKKTTT